ncbi:serine/threonine-protein kinase RIO3 [Condylostylus longicornis]|uniref:serine/threonine-protein kinase RIO3 n=1 Tax=Condylostylus longicornis TaxID=2530218 RepID=UPI00244E1305|nr:serine/threonine-protein kinase RIO3 [Condylostylus longicornis]
MASPWGNIEKVQSTNFEEIMSEEYAKDLQNKEIDKYTKKIRDQINDEKIAGLLQSGVELNEVVSKDTLSNTNFITYSTSTADVLEVLEKNKTENSFPEEVCGSDELIARVLQSQFDHEYNEELKRLEKQKNKESKVSISLENYKRAEDFESDSDEDLDDVYYSEKKDWDRFETNEKRFEAIPKCGFKINQENGKMITKHDSQICSIRNACKVMSFPPEFPTGDGAGFDMKLSNQVYNQLKTYSRNIKKNKMSDRKVNQATAEMGVDARTRLLLYKLINNQLLEQINGIISTGKEALILHAVSDPNYDGDLIIPKECVVKVFKTTLNEFKQRDRYIKDDFRFKNRLKTFQKQNNHVVINMWAEKEMHNLMRMRKFKINCPDVIILKKHILVMSFIGDNHNAAPKLKDAKLTDAELSLAYEEIVDTMIMLYNEVKLIHADLSEYNILWYDGKCWFIDVAQSVEPEHPSALEFLMRDCNNIISFFKRRELPNIMTKEELFEKITSLNAEHYNAGMLEKIHHRGISVLQATAPNLEGCPDEKKPLEYPFELAWEKSMEERNQKSKESDNKIIESTEALKVISIGD